MRFYAIDGSTLYHAQINVLTGEFDWAREVWTYPTPRDLFQNLWDKGLPHNEPVFWEPSQYGYDPNKAEIPIDRSGKRSFQSGRYDPNSQGTF